MSLSKIGIQFFFRIRLIVSICVVLQILAVTISHFFTILKNVSYCHSDIVATIFEKKNTIRKYKYLQIDYYSSTYIWLDFPISLSLLCPTYTLYLVWCMKSKIVSYQCCLKWKINLIKCFLSSLSLHCTRHKNKTIIIGTITHITLKQNLKFCMANLYIYNLALGRPDVF